LLQTSVAELHVMIGTRRPTANRRFQLFSYSAAARQSIRRSYTSFNELAQMRAELQANYMTIFMPAFGFGVAISLLRLPPFLYCCSGL
jgi:hypothetical protein